MRPSFARAEHFLHGPATLLPFRFARIPDLPGQVVLTSEAGEFTFLTEKRFKALVTGRLTEDDPATADLEAKHFIYRGEADVPVRLLAGKLRTRKSFLRNGPSLLIFVVTLRCDHGCHYCQVSRRTQDNLSFDMSQETARGAVDRLFDSPARTLTVEFQGGEPLLAFPRIKQIVELPAILGSH
jgi:sulfatase maturation enzyme AslB (radical SAM superfamily)